jgi:hypothetical protein
VVVIAWQLDLQLSVQSVSITTKVVSSGFHDNLLSKIIKFRKGYFPRSYRPRGNNPFLDLIILDITLS